MINRTLDMKTYGQSYTKMDTNWKSCEYCGSTSDITKEHIPPISMASSVCLSERVIVPACRECNIVLSSNGGLTVDERAEHLYSKLKKRYKKILNMPEWSREELAELKGNLRLDIETSMQLKIDIEGRLNYIDLIYNLNK